MSRFFKTDSDDESDESDSPEEAETTPKPPARFLRGDYSDSDDDEVETKRTVKSTRDKRLDELADVEKEIKVAAKDQDWVVLAEVFEKLNKALQKASAITAKEGTPRVYIRSLVVLDDALKQALIDEKEKGKITVLNQRALNGMKQKLKKNNKPYEAQIAAYRENPDKEEGSDEESDEEVPAPKPAAKKAAAKEPAKKGADFYKKSAKANDDEDSDEDDSDFPDESDDDSDESSDDARDKADPANRANKWLKKEVKKPAASAKPEKPADKAPRPKKEKKAEEEKAKGPSAAEMSAEQVDKRLAELLAARGRKQTDRTEQIQQLEFLATAAKTEVQRLSILMHIVSAQFDINLSMVTHMAIPVWKSCLDNLNRILACLTASPNLVLNEAEDAVGSTQNEDADESLVVTGNLLAFVERLDDEFIKSLQNTPHTQEYVQRLQDEQGFLNLCEDVQEYYQRIQIPKRAARIAARRLEHLYYKHEHDIEALAKAKLEKVASENADSNSNSNTESKKEVAAPVDQTPRIPLRDIVHEQALLIYAQGDDRLRARTMLMHIYHFALHDNFYKARDMMLMSHLQENVHQMDIPTQILFNRTMAQLGLCAFRSNLIYEAHSCLAEICGGGKVKELLAQGTTRYQQDKNPDQEKLEKKRQVPYHMHISLELLECVHLVSALLLEVPNMAANAYDPKKKVISRTFRRLLDYVDRSVFTGPPESNRDYVAAAAKALSSGDWKTCEELVMSLKVWALLPKPDVIKANIKRKIQEEGLRTYLFTYGTFYDSLSLDKLADMFELSKNNVHSLISKMMINEELHASWDQPTDSVIMHRVEPTKLQYLALQFAEKAAVFVENNERLLDSRTGGTAYGYKFDQKAPSKDRPWQDYGNQNRYNNNYNNNQYNNNNNYQSGYQQKRRQQNQNQQQQNQVDSGGFQQAQRKTRGAPPGRQQQPVY